MVQPSTKTERIVTLPEPVSVVEKAHRFASKTASAMRSTLKAVLQYPNKIPVSAIKAIKATKILAGFEVVVNIPKAINEGYTAAKSKTSVERVAHSWQSVFALSNIINGVTDVVEALKVYAVLPQNALSWLSIAEKFLYPFVVVDFINSTYEFAQFEDFYKELRQNVRVIPLKADIPTRVEVLSKSCRYIVEQKDRIKKSLDIGDVAKIEARAHAVLEQIANKDLDIEKAEQFIKTLRTRAHIKLGLEASSIALKTAKVVTIPFALFTPATPELLITVAAISVLQLAHLGLSTAVLTSDPFAESRVALVKTKALKSANTAKTYMQKLLMKAKTHMPKATFSQPLVCKA